MRVCSLEFRLLLYQYRIPPYTRVRKRCKQDKWLRFYDLKPYALKLLLDDIALRASVHAHDDARNTRMYHSRARESANLRELKADHDSEKFQPPTAKGQPFAETQRANFRVLFVPTVRKPAISRSAYNGICA